MIPSNASEEKWRTPYSIPGYPPTEDVGVNLDPRPPRGAEWSWMRQAENILTVAGMEFSEDWRGRKPIFNYYSC
jgi:hypothetical protein